MDRSNHKRIDSLLRGQVFGGDTDNPDIIYRYAECLSFIEKCTVVVSDLKAGTSRIFHGRFSDILGIKRREENENSIWEKEILSLMSAEQMEKKYLSELRYFNFLRHIPRGKRGNYHLESHLKMKDNTGKILDILHRMYYSYEKDSDTVRFGICIYELMVFELPSDSVAIDSLSGKWIEITSKTDGDILSVREKQVLSLVEKGFTSQEIATQLYISKNTVSRHRQEILSKMQVKNSTEACLRAKQLHIL